MATYEFKCDKCGSYYTITRSIELDGDVDGGNCLQCQMPLTRIWAATPSIFKGTGWGKS